MTRSDRWLVSGAGVLLVAAFLALALTSDLNHRIPRFLILYGVAFVAYAVAVWRILQKGDTCSRRWLWWLLAVAVVARLVVLPAQPVMSTDIYRYLWEGRVILDGHNPFAVAPEAPALDPLRDSNYSDINHKDLETIYPPVAQGVFAIAAWVNPGLTAQKAAFTLFDLGTILVLLVLLRRRGSPVMSVAVYAWNPLVIFETSHSGHLDAVGVFFMVLSLWWFLSDARARGAVALAASFLSKYIAVLLGPWLLLRSRYARWIPLTVLVVVLGYLPFASAGSRLFSSLQVYGSEWEFNGLLYWLAALTGADGRIIRLLLALAAVVFILIRAARSQDLITYVHAAVACVLLLSPTLYPWYVVWMVPLLCLRPQRSWILFTGLVFASYWVWTVRDATGQWHLPGVILAVEYIPFYGLLLWDLRRRRRQGAVLA